MADKDFSTFDHGLGGSGGLLRTAREKKNLSRAKLAELAGVNASSIANWELAPKPGGKHPPVGKLAMLCKVLEIDPRRYFDTVLLDIGENVTDDAGRNIRTGKSAWKLKDGKLVGDGFKFQHHFATDDEWLNWSLKTKDINDLNGHLDYIEHALYENAQAVSKLAERISNNKNGPDHDDPSRSDKSNHQEAVDAASDQPKTEDQNE